MIGLPKQRKKQTILNESFNYSEGMTPGMRLSLDALAVLDAIDRRGSFAAAALELDHVPSAITYTVRRMEEDLDLLLFDRRGHRAQFTPAGRRLPAGAPILFAAAGGNERDAT